MKKIKYVRWIDGVAHARKVVKGKEFTKSLETSDPKVAAQRVKMWVEELRAAGWKRSEATRTLDDALVLARKRHWPNLSEATRIRYDVSLGKMAGTLKGKRLDGLTLDDLADYAAERRAAGISPPTVRRDLQALSVVYETAIDAGWTEANPAKTFLKRAARRGLKENAPQTRIATYKEVHDLVRAAVTLPHKTTQRQRMLAAFIIVKTETGLRADELLHMRWRWVDIDSAMQLFVPKPLAKRNKARWVPLTRLARETLYRLSRAYPCPGGEDYLFWSDSGGVRPYSSMWYVFQDAVELAGISEDITLHDLRRTCGARLLRNGMTIEQVSLWLGHSDIRVTQRHYAFLTVDSLHEAIGNEQVREVRPEINLDFLGEPCGSGDGFQPTAGVDGSSTGLTVPA